MSCLYSSVTGIPRMRSLCVVMSLLLVPTAVGGAQDNKNVPPEVDQQKVDAAIRKGVAFLRGLESFGVRKSRRDELVLLTFFHAGVPEQAPLFQKLLKTITETPLTRTYNVALQAMILEELDRVKYQHRIHQCAQFLVDNQCENGQWSYGTPTIFAENIPTPRLTRKKVSTGNRGKLHRIRSTPPPDHRRVKPKVVRKIAVVQRRKAEKSSGDNSNAQYAALGLRACHDAGIILPKNVISAGRRWWSESQYDSQGTYGGYPVRGWAYGRKGKFHPYGSMTAGALGGVCIYDYIQGRRWKTDKTVITGIAWMAKHFTVTENPGPPEKHGEGMNHYYYLYAVERLGMLYDSELIGGHPWYSMGANYLLGAQREDGSWEGDNEISDTCYAILFLRRATSRLDVASVDPGGRSR